MQTTYQVLNVAGVIVILEKSNMYAKGVPTCQNKSILEKSNIRC